MDSVATTSGGSVYKSLFTENSVATQKHNSTSKNTNKIQYKIERSSPSQWLTLGTGVLTKYVDEFEN